MGIVEVCIVCHLKADERRVLRDINDISIRFSVWWRPDILSTNSLLTFYKIICFGWQPTEKDLEYLFVSTMPIGVLFEFLTFSLVVFLVELEDAIPSPQSSGSYCSASAVNSASSSGFLSQHNEPSAILMDFTSRLQEPPKCHAEGVLKIHFVFELAKVFASCWSMTLSVRHVWHNCVRYDCAT